MAFTVTMMAWGVVEYGRQMDVSVELGHAMEAIKWGTDYLLKSHPQPFVLYGEVGSLLLNNPLIASSKFSLWICAGGRWKHRPPLLAAA